MSIINSITHENLISIINSCAQNPSDTKSKDVISDICKNLKYNMENIAILKLIFENKVFYPLPRDVFASSCINGLIELVECLLKNIKNVEIPTTINGDSAIYGVLYRGHIQIAKLLIKNKIFAIRAEGDLGINGLNFACENGLIEIVQLLLDAGIKANVSKLGIYGAAKAGHYEIVKLLLEYPEVNANDSNFSAINKAAKNNYDDIVKLILQKRTNITPANFKSDDAVDKKIISIYNELYPIPCINIAVAPVKIPASPIETSLPSNNNECLNDLLKRLRQEMTKQNIFKITITSESILVTNDLKI